MGAAGSRDTRRLGKAAAAGAEGGSPTAGAGAGGGDGRGLELVFHRGQAEVTPGATLVACCSGAHKSASVQEVAAGAPALRAEMRAAVRPVIRC